MIKRMVLAMVCCVILLTACASTASEGGQDSPGESEPMAGAFGDETEPTEEDLELFAQATQDTDAASYEPLKVSTQVVAGINFRFYCKTPDGTYAYVTIYQSLDAEQPAEVTEISPAE